jgi:hypothetical protein
VIQEALADMPAFAVVFLRAAWEPIFHKFMKVSSVMEDFMAEIITDLQMTCHFIHITLLLLRIKAWTHSTFSPVVDKDSHPSHSASVTLVIELLNLSIYSDTLPCGKALFPYCAWSLMDFCCWYTFSPPNSDHCTHFFFGTYNKWQH